MGYVYATLIIIALIFLGALATIWIAGSEDIEDYYDGF